MPSLGISIEKQKQQLWCWAAAAVATAKHFRVRSRTQCGVANKVLSQTSCCTNGYGAGCNKMAALEDALREVGHFDWTQSGQVSWGDLNKEMKGGRPVGIRLGLNGGGAHFQLIIGTHPASDVEIMDPQGVTVTGPRANLTSNIYGQWTDAYFTKP